MTLGTETSIVVSYMKNEIRWLKKEIEKPLEKTLRKEAKEWAKGYFVGYEECLVELENHLKRLEKKSTKIKLKK